MADKLQTGATWLAGKLSSYVSQTVTYRRGGLSVSLAATKCPVRTTYGGEIGPQSDQWDWIIKASLLVLGGVTVEPQELTDTIEESDGTKCQVMPVGDEKAYRPLDPYSTAWRIHTKRID